MNESTEDRLARIERKLDEMLEFKQLVLTFVTAGAAKKAAMAAKAKLSHGSREV